MCSLGTCVLAVAYNSNRLSALMIRIVLVVLAHYLRATLRPEQEERSGYT